MIDDFEKQEVRSSVDLWSQICGPSRPEMQAEPCRENGTDFQDSFQPVEGQCNGQSNGTNTGGYSSAQWEPMEDSETYIASLENRLKRLKGQSSDVTSRDILRSLSQAKKECWDRFLHDTQASELFQSSDMDESAVEHFKRWLVPEKVAISAEELEYLLRPSQTKDPTQAEQQAGHEDAEEETAQNPEK
ncbi:coiled-coil domain-containing protein 32 [Corythoichthys intestinalis]|uniref:coiled-coil domain-containing protein 32 n=1 Tax=Corythoichthys intestinalis TaxID=161448 RepID=UPI0025A67EAC|nr:coiled-coil domain-containing protein 32 [Corythoichthys intestinalis]XP_061798242.1 coiled-coil domain-containing protein 32-like [Nerophis lumbriciformis]